MKKYAPERRVFTNMPKKATRVQPLPTTVLNKTVDLNYTYPN